MSKIARLRSGTVWFLRILLALAFVTIGFAKFGSPMWIDNFARWGYPDWFRLAVGGLEIISGVSVLIPKTLKLGLASVSVIMIGASITHLRAAEPLGHLVGPAVYLVVVFAIWGLRRSSAPAMSSTRLELGR